MKFRRYRIRGRITNRDEVNNFYPKFLVESEEPFLYDTLLSPDDLELVEEGERVFEPVEEGLGLKSEVMYVKDKPNRTYLFSYPIETDITWGSWVVSFDQNVDFEGNVYPE